MTTTTVTGEMARVLAARMTAHGHRITRHVSIPRRKALVPLLMSVFGHPRYSAYSLSSDDSTRWPY
jgi:hypothetical protein